MHPKLKNCVCAVTTCLIVFGFGAPAYGNLGEETDTASEKSSDQTVDSSGVAYVNGAVIDRAQFENALAYQQEIAAIRGVSITDEQLPELQYEVLENLINQELLYQESRRFGIVVEETEIDDAYRANQQKASFETEAEFEEALKKSNKTVASYREEIGRGLAIDRFVQAKFADHTVVSEADVKNYYDSNTALFQQPEQVRVSHIMIRVAPDADQSQKDDARKKIAKVLERLQAGEDFAAVSGEVSEDVQSKDSGGDLGVFSRGQLPQAFETAAFAMEKGGISGILETASGYHVIKLTDRQDARTVSYEEAKNDIMDSLKTGAVNSSVDRYIKKVKIRSTLVTYPIGR